MTISLAIDVAYVVWVENARGTRVHLYELQTLFRRILLFKSLIKCYSLYLFMVLNKNGNKMINFTHNVRRYLNPGVT